MTGSGQSLGRPEPWPAPAKLNLFLHIVGRRADGYHLLQTLFRLIDLQDELRFWRRPPGTIERIGDVPGVPAAADLTLEAARRLNERAGGCHGVAIELRKRIPVQSGLGGGSSDAATVLAALNVLWGLGLKPEALAGIGLELGADVPFFLLGRNAWGEGVGERLTPLDVPPAQYVVVRPDAAVSTASVFQAPELTRDSPILKIRGFLQSGGRNDCEAVVRRRYPAVGEALDWLSAYTESRLTGTGSCVYGEISDEAAASAVLARLPARWQGWHVRGLDESPLVDRLELERSTGGAAG
jgi:4-diphosphocytidyl-2-C-methyl-D-erythritol kinase